MQIQQITILSLITFISACGSSSGPGFIGGGDPGNNNDPLIVDPLPENKNSMLLTPEAMSAAKNGDTITFNFKTPNDKSLQYTIDFKNPVSHDDKNNSGHNVHIQDSNSMYGLIHSGELSSTDGRWFGFTGGTNVDAMPTNGKVSYSGTAMGTHNKAFDQSHIKTDGIFNAKVDFHEGTIDGLITGDQKAFGKQGLKVRAHFNDVQFEGEVFDFQTPSNSADLHGHFTGNGASGITGHYEGKLNNGMVGSFGGSATPPK